MIFLPKEHASRLACEQEMERAIKAEGQVLLGWRDVPVNRDMPMSPTVRKRSPSCARSSSAVAPTSSCRTRWSASCT
jgi:glutamate synthase domain-containing protein 1